MGIKTFWGRSTGLTRFLIIIVPVLTWAAADYFGFIPGSSIVKSLVPQKAELPTLSTAPTSATSGFVPSQPPSNIPARIGGVVMRIAGWAWNSQAGQWFAMGGKTPMKGSLMEKYGANVLWYRQDVVDQMQNDLVTCANEMAKSTRAECTNGATHVSIMWDGAPNFVTSVNRLLSKIGPDYVVEFVGSLGYSRGEDKFMGLPEWKSNPQLMRGALIAGVLRDGDWNIVLKLAGDNDIPNNPDERTYDPDAINWLATQSYIEASEKYIAGSASCETRPVVRKGRLTGEKKEVCVNGVVTWTPGDVMVAKKRGGLVSIVSTKEYRSQMPNAIIGIRRFNSTHPELIEGFLRASFEGADNIKLNPSALPFAAKVSADVYREETPAYWQKYYTVQQIQDAQGLTVEVGGSYANNLADNLVLFGLMPGSPNVAEAVYTTFGNILVQQYPKDFPSYTPANQIINTRFIKALRDKVGTTTEADLPTFSSSSRIADVVSQRSWHINFVSGSDQFTPDALADLRQLLNDLVIAGSLAIEVHGHTDSNGDAVYNEALSERRAFAVKNWLQSQASANFPSNRIRIRAHGEEDPVAPNDTEAGRAQNRRVDIILGSTN